MALITPLGCFGAEQVRQLWNSWVQFFLHILAFLAPRQVEGPLLWSFPMDAPAPIQSCQPGSRGPWVSQFCVPQNLQQEMIMGSGDYCMIISKMLCPRMESRFTSANVGMWSRTVLDLLLLLSCSVMSDSLPPNQLQHAGLPCPPLSPRVYSNSCPLSQWCHPTISSSVIPFSSCHQSCPASGSLPVSWLFLSGTQSTRVSASASVLPVNIQSWFPLGLTDLISLETLQGAPKSLLHTTVGPWKERNPWVLFCLDNCALMRISFLMGQKINQNTVY